MIDSSIPGKRYWWEEYRCVYSGLYTGEQENGNYVLVRRNGEAWNVGGEFLYANQDELIKDVLAKRRMKYKNLIFRDKK